MINFSVHIQNHSNKSGDGPAILERPKGVRDAIKKYAFEEVNRVMFEDSKWLRVSCDAFHGPQSFEVCGCFIPFVTHRDRDANGKRMVGLSHKLKYLRQEARTCNEKFGRTSRNYKSLEGHQEIIKAFVEENKKLAHERMKTR